jgi:hypothetical protein
MSERNQDLRAQRCLSLHRWRAFAGRGLMEYVGEFPPPPHALEEIVGGDWEVLEVDHGHGGAALLRCGADYLVATPYGWLHPGPIRGQPTLAEVRAELGLERYHDALVLERLSAL